MAGMSMSLVFASLTISGVVARVNTRDAPGQVGRWLVVWARAVPLALISAFVRAKHCGAAGRRAPPIGFDQLAATARLVSTWIRCAR